MDGALGGDLQWPHDPHQYRAQRLVFELAARPGGHDVDRQEKAKTTT
jgi:hypothetical protein